MLFYLEKKQQRKCMKTYLRRVLLFWTRFTSSSSCWIRLRTYMCCCKSTPSQSSSQRTVTLRSSATSICTCGHSTAQCSSPTCRAQLCRHTANCKVVYTRVHRPTEHQKWGVCPLIPICKTNVGYSKSCVRVFPRQFEWGVFWRVGWRGGYNKYCFRTPELVFVPVTPWLGLQRTAYPQSCCSNPASWLGLHSAHFWVHPYCYLEKQVGSLLHIQKPAILLLEYCQVKLELRRKTYFLE